MKKIWSIIKIIYELRELIKILALRVDGIMVARRLAKGKDGIIESFNTVNKDEATDDDRAKAAGRLSDILAGKL